MDEHKIPDSNDKQEFTFQDDVPPVIDVEAEPPHDDVPPDPEPAPEEEEKKGRFGRKKKEKKPKNVIKETFLAFLLVAIGFLVWEYLMMTPVNLHSPEFLKVLAAVLIGFAFLRLLFIHKLGKFNILLILCGFLSLGAMYVGPRFADVKLHAKAYANQITLDASSDFQKDMDNVGVNAIPSVDKEAAIELGDKKMGTLTDYVSQFEISKSYAQINYKGRPVRVTTLKYAGFYQYITNFLSGIPAYITVDMITQDTQVVELGQGIKFSPGERFHRNVSRWIRFHYPTLMFDDPHFEIDESGTPYWVAPVYTYDIAFFGGKEMTGAVLVNAQTGALKYYSLAKVPEWVDKVYSADLVMTQLKNTGKYSSGYLNTLFSKKGVLTPTDGYNYLALDNDIWLYTGMTSVSGDDSNVGFVLVNLRTKETKYYPIAGASESAAMKSAKGKVQNLGYTPTFPILINVEDTPTYFLSLKDDNALVKKYAFVSVENYALVGVGDTIKSARTDYVNLLKDNGALESTEEETTTETQTETSESTTTEDNNHTSEQTQTSNAQSVSGTISLIKEVVVEGTTTYYIHLTDDDTTYVAPITVSSQLVSAQAGQAVSITYTTSEGADTATVTAITFTSTQ